MEKEEAERLKSAMQTLAADWIKAEAVVRNRVRRRYEIQCALRLEHGEVAPGEGIWTRIFLQSPREWSRLLIKHRDDLERQRREQP